MQLIRLYSRLVVQVLLPFGCYFALELAAIAL